MEQVAPVAREPDREPDRDRTGSEVVAAAPGAAHRRAEQAEQAAPSDADPDQAEAAVPRWVGVRRDGTLVVPVVPWVDRAVVPLRAALAAPSADRAAVREVPSADREAQEVLEVGPSAVSRRAVREEVLAALVDLAAPLAALVAQ